MNQKKKVLVLDTSSFIIGYDPLSIKEEQFTVSLVLKELFPQSTAFMRLKLAIETERLCLRAPSPDFIREIEIISAKTGDLLFLSEADKQVLALSLELKAEGFLPTIVTDDYSIQNVADQLGLNYSSLATFGIRHRFHWILYCPGCHKTYLQKKLQKTCILCGTKLSRKILRKTQKSNNRRKKASD